MMIKTQICSLMHSLDHPDREFALRFMNANYTKDEAASYCDRKFDCDDHLSLGLCYLLKACAIGPDDGQEDLRNNYIEISEKHADFGSRAWKDGESLAHR